MKNLTELNMKLSKYRKGLLFLDEALLGLGGLKKTIESIEYDIAEDVKAMIEKLNEIKRTLETKHDRLFYYKRLVMESLEGLDK